MNIEESIQKALMELGIESQQPMDNLPTIQEGVPIKPLKREEPTVEEETVEQEVVEQEVVVAETTVEQEETIQKALSDLGIAPAKEEASTSHFEPEPIDFVPNMVQEDTNEDKEVVNEVVNVPNVVQEEETEISLWDTNGEPTFEYPQEEEETVEESKEPTVEDEETEEEWQPSIFVKISGDSMAILIPKEIKMRQKTIAGEKFSVVTVERPKFNSHFQALEVLSLE